MDNDRADSLKALGDFVAGEISSAAQRRASFDTRAFSLITANFAFTTFYFAVRSQLGSPSHTAEGWVKALTVAGAVASVLSIACAVMSVLPKELLASDPATLEAIRTEIAEDKQADVRLEILEAQIKLYERNNQVSDAKGEWARRAFYSTSIVIVMYVVASVIVGVTA